MVRKLDVCWFCGKIVYRTHKHFTFVTKANYKPYGDRWVHAKCSDKTGMNKRKTSVGLSLGTSGINGYIQREL